MKYFNDTDEIESRAENYFGSEKKILAAPKNKNFSFKNDLERINGIIDRFKRIMIILILANKILGKRLAKIEKGI